MTAARIAYCVLATGVMLALLFAFGLALLVSLAGAAAAIVGTAGFRG